MHEVHGPGLVRARRRSAVVPQLGLDPVLGRFVAQLQAQFAIDAPRLVLPVRTALAAQQHMNPAVAVAHARLADLSDPKFKGGLSGASRFVVVGGRINQEDAARAPDRNTPVATHLVDQLALPDRLQSFRRRAS